MQRLKAIQQRVFCVFMRPYQRSTGDSRNVKPTQKLTEVEFSELAWYDPTLCTPCPPTTGQQCPTCPTLPDAFRPLGPSNLIPSISSGLNAITDPNSTRLLKMQEQALQYYNYSATGAKTIKPFVEGDSRTLQPFNEDKMFTEDLWFLHSTWTSFEKTKLVIRPLVDSFGFDAIMVCAYVPIDMEILPNK